MQNYLESNALANIVVIDDDIDVAKVIENMLSSAGHTVILAEGDILKALQSDDVDLVISDLFMPDINGLEVILSVREHIPTLPIILITGGGRQFPMRGDGISDLIESAKMFGATEFLFKPFRKHELLGVVDRLITS